MGDLPNRASVKLSILEWLPEIRLSAMVIAEL